MNLLEKYFDKINELSNMEGVFGVYIFGSYAKKKESKKSDLDVCFLIEPNNTDLIKEIISYSNKELDLNILSELPLSVQFDVLKNGNIFKINDKENFSKQKMYVLRRYKDENWVYKNSYYNRYGVEV